MKTLRVLAILLLIALIPVTAVADLQIYYLDVGHGTLLWLSAMEKQC